MSDESPNDSTSKAIGDTSDSPFIWVGRKLFRQMEVAHERVHYLEAEVAAMKRVCKWARIVIQWADTTRLDALRDALRDLDSKTEVP